MIDRRDITLWVRQHREHCEFIDLGAVHPAARRTAERLARSWQNLGDRPYSARILPILEATHDLERSLYVATKSGTWVGWLASDFYHHIGEESDYFRRLLTDPPTPSRELSIWTDILGDHAISLGTMVDPSRRGAIARGFEIGDAAKRARSIAAARSAGEEIDMFLKSTARMPSTIPQALREHALREDAHFRDVVAPRIARGVR